MLNTTRNRPKVVNLLVRSSDLPSRLDGFLAIQTGLGRNQVKRYIQNSCVTAVRLDAEVAVKPSLKLKEGDKVRLSYPSKGVLAKPNIIYQDDDIIAINKPAGVLTHAKTASDDEWTAQDLVQSLIADSPRGGLVHRLDRDTSGVLLFSRTASAHASLANQFKAHRINKQYLAIVSGKPRIWPVTLDWPIARS